MAFISTFLASGLSRVVGLAIQALLSHNMILHLRRLTAIVAKNPDLFVQGMKFLTLEDQRLKLICYNIFVYS